MSSGKFSRSPVFVLIALSLLLGHSAAAESVRTWCGLRGYTTGICSSTSSRLGIGVTSSIGFILKTYQDLLKRPPTIDEYDVRYQEYVVNRLRTADQVRLDVLSQPSSMRAWCGLQNFKTNICADSVALGTILNDDKTYVLNLYGDLLRRPPTKYEFNNWSGKLIYRQTTRLHVFNEVQELPEYLQVVKQKENEGYVKNLYRTLLAKEPDPTGVSNYSKQISSGQKTREAVRAEIKQSSEFNQATAHTTNENYVRRLYKELLGVKPSEDRVSHFTQILDSGSRTRAEVTKQFATAPMAKTEAKLMLRIQGSRVSGNVIDITPTSPNNWEVFLSRDVNLNPTEVMRRDVDSNSVIHWEVSGDQMEIQTWTHRDMETGIVRETVIDFSTGHRTDKVFDPAWDPAGFEPIYIKDYFVPATQYLVDSFDSELCMVDCVAEIGSGGGGDSSQVADAGGGSVADLSIDGLPGLMDGDLVGVGGGGINPSPIDPVSGLNGLGMELSFEVLQN